MWRRFNKPNLILVLWLAANIGMEFAYALYTGISMGSITGRSYLPVARFIYPTFLAIAAILCAGWLTLIRLLPIKYKSVGITAVVVSFIILDVISIISIRNYWG